ncbi:MAG: 50S ribosomal protein L10 [Clostridiales Family XIII bacterium]|jgi:large subunit ribosomal protein L10|nr:50S ribosomal protein L10 [Clostridiales Family XIII bacterium]
MSVESLKQKQGVIDEIRAKLDKAESAVIIDYIGITVAEADAMRKKLREADIDYKIYKNTLIGRAIDGSDYSQFAEVLSGPSALAVSYDDATAPARILNGVMKEYKKMSFKAGYVDGTYYDADRIKEIADIPSRDDLIAKFLGSIQSPLGAFVRTLAAIAEKGTDAAAPAEDAAEEAAPEAPAEAAVAEAPAEEAAPEAPAEETAAEAPAEEAAPEAPAEEEPVEQAPAEETPTEA